MTLYQAEWCPYSHLVRQRLTELGLDFVAKQVEPDPEQRDAMRRETGSDVIPVLVLDDGTVLAKEARDIIRELDRRFRPGPHAEDHRRKAREHE